MGSLGAHDREEAPAGDEHAGCLRSPERGRERSSLPFPSRFFRAMFCTTPSPQTLGRRGARRREWGREQTAPCVSPPQALVPSPLSTVSTEDDATDAHSRQSWPDAASSVAAGSASGDAGPAARPHTTTAALSRPGLLRASLEQAGGLKASEQERHHTHTHQDESLARACASSTAYHVAPTRRWISQHANSCQPIAYRSFTLSGPASLRSGAMTSSTTSPRIAVCGPVHGPSPLDRELVPCRTSSATS